MNKMNVFRTVANPIKPKAFLVFCAGVVLATFGLCAAQNEPGTSSQPNRSSSQPVGETVNVTADYEPAPLDELDRTVQVLQVTQTVDLFRSWADVLRLDSSIDLRQRAPGTQADLSIRGSSFGETLVLVDGMRINDAQSAHHNLDLPIPFSSIQRIEVLHGSGSTLYGSDAVGGAVNFITATPAASEIKIGLAGGSFGTNTQNAIASYVAQKWSEQVDLTRDVSSGFMPDRDYRNFAGSSETRFQTSLGGGAVLLALSDRPFGANQFYGNFNSWERTKGWFGSAIQNIGTDTQLAVGYRRHTDEFILLRDDPSFYENNHVTDSWQGAARHRAKLTPNNSLYVGGEVYSDSIASNNLGYHSRAHGAVYSDFSARSFKRFSISAGAREEVFAGGHAQFSPNAVLAYPISSHWRWRASVAHAFRLPTYTDLYYHDPANIGNPSLRPEMAWGYEGGAEWNAGKDFFGTLTLFHRREHDVIDYVRSTPIDVWQAVNIQKLQFTGFEALANLRLPHSQRLLIGYTGLYGAQQALAGLESKYVFDYPVHQATIQWLGTIPGGAQIRMRSGVTDRYNSDPYSLLEISVARHWGRIEPYVQVTNLTDTQYEEIQGVPMPGRAYLLGMQLTLGRHSPTTTNLDLLPNRKLSSPAHHQ